MPNYSGFWRRFGAAIIDGIIMQIAQLIILLPLGGGLSLLGPSDAAAGGFAILSWIVLLVAQWLYYALMESSAKQATLGKMALGIIVTDTDGQRISFLRATGRYFGKIISALILMIGYIMAAFTERKQALHDIMASTLVYEAKPGQVGSSAAVFD